MIDNEMPSEDVTRGAVAAVIKPVLFRDSRDPEAALAEAVGLARAIGLKVATADIVNLSRPQPSTLFGSGVVEEWKERIAVEKTALVVVDHSLSPVQQRNLEREWKCKVIDRTGLILEIFGERARTKEGQLQVELAALNYQKSRLVRSWTHLERQRGGFGFLGGPGESQLEVDRRIISDRISGLKKDLQQVRRTRGLQRGARQRAGHPTVALVGYTNAGKSTLFNRLTGSDALAKDMLFATLDPTMRGISLPDGREIILSDTVGFISDLPTHLIESFRATLEEVQLADAILHVRDVSHPEAAEQKKAVEKILSELGIARDDERVIEVLNKTDLLTAEERETLRAYSRRATRDSSARPEIEREGRGACGGTVAVSALTGEGIDELLRLVSEILSAGLSLRKLSLPLSDGAAIAWLYEHGNVIKRRDREAKTTMEVAMDEADWGRFAEKFPPDDSKIDR